MPKNKNIHDLCTRCRNTCKQPLQTDMLTCDLFEGKMGDEEFSRLLSEMDHLIENVNHLNRRSSHLLAEMQEPDTDQDLSPDITGG